MRVDPHGRLTGNTPVTHRLHTGASPEQWEGNRAPAEGVVARKMRCANDLWRIYGFFAVFSGIDPRSSVHQRQIRRGLKRLCEPFSTRRAWVGAAAAFDFRCEPSGWIEAGPAAFALAGLGLALG